LTDGGQPIAKDGKKWDVKNEKKEDVENEERGMWKTRMRFY
jgi:hypothetical protein